MKKLIVAIIISFLLAEFVLSNISGVAVAKGLEPEDRDIILATSIRLETDFFTPNSNSINKILWEQPPILAEIWVDDDYTNISSGGHTWGVDAFNRIQAAIDASASNSSTTINILPGDYFERITINKPVKLKGEYAGDNKFVANISGAFGDKWALICVSANDMSVPDRDCFPAQGLQAYYTLKNLGYDDEHIILMLWHDDESTIPLYNCEPNDDNDGLDEYVSIYDGTNNWLFGPDGQPGVAGVDDDNNGSIDDLDSNFGEYPAEFGWPGSDDPIIDVDNKNVTKASLQQQIMNLSNLVTADDHVLFYFVDHSKKYGTPQKAHMYFEDTSAGPAEQYLDADTLDSWLDQVNCKRMTILIDMCRTGNFTNSSLGLTEESNRLIIGAAGDINNIAHAWFDANSNHFAGSWFFHPFWERINAGESVQQAYQYALIASDKMAEDYPYPYQYPFLLNRLRDSDQYSFIPYGGKLINIINPAIGEPEISNCLITGEQNKTSIGINLENHYVDISQALVNQTNATYYNVTSNCSAEDSSYFDLFPAYPQINDSFLVGATDIFSRIYIKLAPGGFGAGGSFILEYATDRDTWSPLDIQSDTTQNLTQSGDILFNPPNDWAYQAHNHSVTLEKTKYCFWVRLRVVENYTAIPKGDYIDLSYYSEGAVKIINNRIISHETGIHIEGFDTQMPNRGQFSNFEIKNNVINANDRYGIYLEDSNNNTISNNLCLWNTQSGIRIQSSKDNSLDKNNCSSSEAGIILYLSNYNSITNNTCNLNNVSSIYIWQSDYNTVFYNICNLNNRSGICIWYSNNIIMVNNTCNSNKWSGITVLGDGNDAIDNLCNLNQRNGIIFEDGTKLNLANRNICIGNEHHGIYFGGPQNIITNNICNSSDKSGIYIYNDNPGQPSLNIIENNICNSNNWSGIHLGSGSDSNVIINNNCSSNNYFGIYLYTSSDNIIENCSILNNSAFDVYFENKNSKNNIAINTTFNTIYFYDLTSEFIIKNYLFIQLNDSTGLPIHGVDVEVKDNDLVEYKTLEFGGTDPKTDSMGQLTWILVTDRIYYGTPAVENITVLIVKFGDVIFWNNSRDIDMSISHFEHFYPNSIPGKIILKGPMNNSYLNDSTPELQWHIGMDGNSDGLSYFVQVDDLVGDWTGLIADVQTDTGVLAWNSTIHIPDGDYKWRVCGCDGYGNGSWSEIWRFKLDSTAPSSIILSPINNRYYFSLDTISGIASDSDLIEGTGIKQIEIMIQRLDDDNYWSGLSWVATETWLLTSGFNNWVYDSSSVPWSSGVQYIVQSRASDLTGNMESPSPGNIFIIDMEDPWSVIEGPINDTYLNRLDNISGRAGDSSGSGISEVEISINRLSDNTYWDGNGWNINEAWLTVTGTELWYYNTTTIEWLSDVHYLLSSQAIDSVNNIETPRTGITFMYDNRPPEELTIKINNDDEFTNSNSVSLTLHSIDLGAGISNMAFSIDNIVWSPWEPFNTAKTYFISNVEGAKKIYFKVDDKIGNIAQPVFDIIILDRTPPYSLFIWINNGTSETNSTSVTITINASDELSGLYQMRFREGKSNWSSWEFFQETWIYDISAGDGKKTIYIMVKDRAGNIAEPVSASIILNTSIPEPDDQKNGEQPEKPSDSSLMLWLAGIGIIVIIIVVLLVFFILIKKRKKLTEADKDSQEAGPPEKELVKNKLKGNEPENPEKDISKVSGPNQKGI